MERESRIKKPEKKLVYRKQELNDLAGVGKIFDILDKKVDKFNLKISVGQGRNIAKAISKYIFDDNRWSIKFLADYIIKHRKEIGLYKKSDFEIDIADVEEAIGRTHIKLCNVPYVNWVDKLAEAIVKKNPIKIKGEK